MAGRNIPQRPLHILHPHPTQIEELSSLQHHNIQALLVDNQRLAATHVALKQELALSHQELRHLSAALPAVEAETDARVREVFDKAVKMEAELRLVRECAGELERVREDIRRMEEDKRELLAKVEEVEEEVRVAKGDVGEVERVREEIEVMRRETFKGRAAIEYEKKLHATNIGVSNIFEDNMASMAREMEKLLAELANAEKMARAAAAAAATPGPAYAAGYTLNSYAGTYAAQQGKVDSGSQYGSGAAAYSQYDTQQNDYHER